MYSKRVHKMIKTNKLRIIVYYYQIIIKENHYKMNINNVILKLKKE